MSTLLTATAAVKNLNIAVSSLSTLYRMGVVVALHPLRFSPLLWEPAAAQVLWAVTPTCHSLWGGRYRRNTSPLRGSVTAGLAILSFLVFINKVWRGYTGSQCWQLCTHSKTLLCFCTKVQVSYSQTTKFFNLFLNTAQQTSAKPAF